MSFGRYDGHRGSADSWIGHLPTHWERGRLRNVVEIKKRIAGVEGPDILSITQRGIRVRDTSSNEGQLAESYAHYQRVDVGDFAMNHMDLLTGWVDISRYEGVTSPDYRVFSLRPKADIEPSYLLRVLQNAYSQRIFYAFGQGASHLGRWRLPTDAFQDFEIPLPPVDEQRAIATFLDRETAKIDTLVEEQRKLIELVSEQMSASSLSDFGSWPMARLSTVAELVARPVCLEPSASYEPLGLFNRGRGLFHKEPQQGAEIGDSDFNYVEPGDLILSGQFAWEGAVAMAGEEEFGCVASHRYHLLRGKGGALLTEYLFAVLCSRHGNFLLAENSRGAAGRNRPLNIRSLLKEVIPVPALEVQEQVARAVRARQQIMTAASAQSILLRERRAALIAAAVTGSIDVRDSAAALAALEPA